MINNEYTARRTRILGWVAALFIGGWLIVPMLVAVPMSFTGVESFVFPPPRWSTRWYEELVGDLAWRRAIFNSAAIAVTVTLVAVPLGTAAALALRRMRPRIRTFVWALLLFPLVVPVVVFAAGLYLAYLRWQLLNSFWGIVFAHVVLVTPAVVVTVSTSLQGLDTRLERAAASLGAGPWRTFRQVTLPLIAPGVVGGGLFCLIGSLDETVVTQFVSGPGTRTLPVQVFYSITQEIDPTVAAVTTLNIAVTWVLLLIAVFVMVRRSRRLLLKPDVTAVEPVRQATVAQ